MRLVIKDDDSVQVELDQQGGNPNYVETIEGTVASPFGDKDFSQLLSDSLANNITIYGEINVGEYSGVRAYAYASAEYSTIALSLMLRPALNTAIGVGLLYDSSGLRWRYATQINTQSGTAADYTDYILPLDAVVTTYITHHPLPENSNNEEE